MAGEGEISRLQILADSAKPMGAMGSARRDPGASEPTVPPKKSELSERSSEALSILDRYYADLLARAADEIIDDTDAFDADAYSTHGADQILDRYVHHLGNLCLLRQHFQNQLSQPQMRKSLQVKALVYPRDSIEQALEEWMRENPRIEPISVSFLHGEQGTKCLIVYWESMIQPQ